MSIKFSSSESLLFELSTPFSKSELLFSRKLSNSYGSIRSIDSVSSSVVPSGKVELPVNEVSFLKPVITGATW